MERILLGCTLCIILTVLGEVFGYEHFELMEEGKKYSWIEASQKCWTRGSTLPNWNFLSLSQKLVNGSDIWTSLQLVNGYIQEVTTHISYTDISNKLWEENRVWNDNSCVKFTAEQEFKVVKCSTLLPVVCQLQELQNLDCKDGVPPILTVKVSGKSVNVKNGELNIRESEQNNLSLHCKAFTENSAFDWIKDGVYINARKNIIYPARTEDPSKLSNSYSTQGTYWCEAWVPGCANKHHSNKINLKFKQIVTLRLNLRKEEIADLHSANVLRILKPLIPSQAEENIIKFDVRRGYTSIGKQNVSSFNFNIYIHAYDQGQSFLTNEMEFTGVSTDNMLFRGKRQSQPTMHCPKYFELQHTYCYKITKDDTWRKAYENCFQNGIEKTPLDVKNYWSNEQFIGELINNGVTSIWLPAERKVGGGPVYFSGPVASDFNYNNYSATNDFNITWKTQDFNINNKCLVLNIKQKFLDIVSCEEHFPFVCLFPSEFWTQNITYDSFYEDGIEEDEIIFMPWIEARMICKALKGYDLINKNSESYNANINPKGQLLSFIGKQNSALQRDNQSHIYTAWNQYEINTNNLFHEYNDGFISRNHNESKIFVCMSGVVHIYSKLQIKQTQGKTNQIMISTINTDELNFLYGIKCYLNGKLVKNDRTSIFETEQQGYLFCEAISHTPVKLISSDVIHVHFPDVISFVCEIFVGNEKYSFQLHDLTFQSEDVGGVLFYEKLLNKKLQPYNVTILNMTESIDKSGINIEFYIEMHAEDNQVFHFYNSIYSLLEFNDKDWASKNVTVNYLRNTKYCMSEIQQLPETTGCKSNITWPDTLVNEIYECIECKKLQKRYCSGTLMMGAKWEQLITVDIPYPSQNIPLCNPDNIIEETIDILNITSDLKDTLSNTTGSVTKLIHTFENILSGNEVNEVRNIGNSQVAIYSSKFENNVRGYFLKQTEKFKKIENNGTFENDVEIEDVVSTVYLNFNNEKNGVTNTTILLTLFQNSTIFPDVTKNFSRISPVLLINIPNAESLSFPIHILHSVEYKDKINSSYFVCGYWNETTHEWEESEADKYEGRTKNGLFNCTYNHLTCFAMLVHGLDEKHEVILNIFTQIGCYLSLIGLGLILTAFILLRRWRDKTHDIKILFSLSFSLFVMYLLFLTGINQSSMKGLCIAIGATLHYFILTSFCWMLVVAYHNYLKFDKVVGTYIPRFMMKASLGAWTVPAIPIIIILSINHRLYTDNKFCWIHSEGFYYGFLVPVCFIWLLNVIVFIRILYNICMRQIGPSNVDQRSLLVSQVMLSLFLFVMLGLSWVFGFFAAAQISVVFSYLFCITSTTQGFLIFVFFILLEKKAKDKWIKFFRPCFRPQEQVSSDSRSRKTSGTELMQKSSTVSYSSD